MCSMCLTLVFWGKTAVANCTMYEIYVCILRNIWFSDELKVCRCLCSASVINTGRVAALSCMAGYTLR